MTQGEEGRKWSLESRARNGKVRLEVFRLLRLYEGGSGINILKFILCYLFCIYILVSIYFNTSATPASSHFLPLS